MLGGTIEDPLGVESDGVARSVAGLGRLRGTTVMRGEKTVRRVAGVWNGAAYEGYEIHMGETVPEQVGAIVQSGRTLGTYIHGLFDADGFRHEFLRSAREACGLAPVSNYVNATAARNGRIDRWAGHLRRSLNLKLIGEWTGL
jgi:adenosylcobyric acid synthase